jgi:hypothetical protein
MSSHLCRIGGEDEQQQQQQQQQQEEVVTVTWRDMGSYDSFNGSVVTEEFRGIYLSVVSPISSAWTGGR